MPTNAEHQTAWRRRHKEKIAALTEAQTRIRELEGQLDAARARIHELETGDRASQAPEGPENEMAPVPLRSGAASVTT